MQQYTEHLAAVKAIAWSPHQHGLLASGGGTADRCIRFWNTLTGQPLQCIDTGSQVCNLAWSKHANELVSTHGYSQNQILVWKYPSLTQVAKLTGHSYRVLYLAMSPDGEAIVTGAGDETLRFWNVFSKTRSTKVKWVGLSAVPQIPHPPASPCLLCATLSVHLFHPLSAPCLSIHRSLFLSSTSSHGSGRAGTPAALSPSLKPHFPASAPLSGACSGRALAPVGIGTALGQAPRDPPASGQRILG